MPIYEYRRPDGTTFEVVQAFSDDPLTVDPETGVPVERVLHPPAVHFKGTGFYNTDYGTRKRNRETQAAGESSSAGGKDSSADSAGAESAKPAGKDASAAGARASEPGGTGEAGKSGKDAKKGAGESRSKRTRTR